MSSVMRAVLTRLLQIGPILALALPVAADTAHLTLIDDLNARGASPYTVYPPHMTRVGNRYFFTGHTAFEGDSLWVTDVTAQGTKRVTTIHPGLSTDKIDAGDGAAVNTATGTELVFAADDREHGKELWRSDGTESGTAMVMDIAPGAESSFPSDFTAYGDGVVFSARDANGRDQLWYSDLTEAGTYAVTDFNASGSAQVDRVVVSADNVFFRASLDDGPQVWRWDGADNPLQLTSAPQDRFNYQSIVADGEGGAYIVPEHDSEELNLWHTDGTVAGTDRVIDINPTGPDYATRLTLVGDTLYFSASDTGQPYTQLYKTDGTAAGTTRVDAPASNLDDIVGMTAVGDLGVAFIATTPDYGTEVWVSDGTPAGTRLLADIAPGTESSNPTNIQVEGNTLWFVAEGDGAGRELRVADFSGSSASVVDALPGAESTFPQADRAVEDVAHTLTVGPEGALFFGACEPDSGLELCLSDGTTDGTDLLADVNPATQTGVDFSVYEQNPALGESVIFTGNDGMTGRELWSLQPGGVEQVRDIAQGEPGSWPRGFTRLGDRLLFTAETEAQGEELWVTDGTVGGTSLVKDVRSGEGGSSPDELVALNGVVLMNPFASGYDLWVTDGTEQGTRAVQPTGASIEGPVRYLTAVGDQLYFLSGRDDEQVIWRTDGTDQGTEPWVTVEPAQESDPQGAQSVVATADHLLYRYGSNELWAVDFATGTQVQLLQVPEGNYIGSVESVGGAQSGYTVFDAETDAAGPEPWITDGTVAGTRQIGEIYRGDEGLAPFQYQAWNDKLYFLSHTGNTPGNLRLHEFDWQTDTLTVLSPEGHIANHMFIYQDQLYYVTQGENIGLHRVVDSGVETLDINMGREGDRLHWLFLFHAADERAYMVGHSEQTGYELWELTIEKTDAGSSSSESSQPGGSSSSSTSSVSGGGDSGGGGSVFWLLLLTGVGASIGRRRTSC